MNPSETEGTHAITAFLLARLDHRETVARRDMQDQKRAGRPLLRLVRGTGSRDQVDPARALEECQIQKRVVTRCTKWIADGAPEAELGDEIIRDLAAIYDDHPDYDQAWRP